MPAFHFVEDYEKHVDGLLKSFPVDQAMEMAVGGHYELFGAVELNILSYAGLSDGMSLLDIGCGSGRLAAALGKAGPRVQYVGLDIVQSLLDYAATKSPEHFVFVLNRQLNVPSADCSLDMACGFSLFTHLLHQETYIYMEDIFRALRPGGKLVFSFLEFACEDHWPTFVTSVQQTRDRTAPHLNTFIERSVVVMWAGYLGFEVEGFIGGSQPVNGGGPLGQSTAILRRPES